MSKRARLSAGLVSAALMSLVGCSAEPSQPNSVAEPQLAEGSDRLPNESVTDWVTFADHVVAVTVVAETAGKPADEEVERGEGLIPRTVDLRVDETLWSSTDPAREVPRTMTGSAWGWVFHDGADTDPMENAQESVGEGWSRLEVGHSYIMAIDWESARCADGDGRQDAGWAGLGAGSRIPFDGGVAGVGEYEGTNRTLKEAEAEVSALPEGFVPFSLEAVGHDQAWITARLREAKPDAALAKEYAISSAPCSE